MRTLGAVLLVLGVVALVYGGVSWTRKDTVIDAGPVEVTADKRETLALPPLVGLALVAGGLVLVMRKSS